MHALPGHIRLLGAGERGTRSRENQGWEQREPGVGDPPWSPAPALTSDGAGGAPPPLPQRQQALVLPAGREAAGAQGHRGSLAQIQPQHQLLLPKSSRSGPPCNKETKTDDSHSFGSHR